MALTNRQKITIEHLKNINKISSPEAIIAFCEDKLTKPSYGLSPSSRRNLKTKGLPYSKKRTGTRKHSRKYYQGIINFYKNV